MSDLPKLPELLQTYGVNIGIDKVNDSQISNPTKQNFNNFTLPLSNPEEIQPFWKIRPNYKSSFEAFVPIQNGCDKFCSFCAVPYTRGREISRPSDEIIQEVKYLIDNNFKSITLLGQNVNSYGKDKNGDEISFAKLLEQIGKLGIQSGKEFWVYFTSPHPRDMNKDVIETIARYPNLAKQIHLPLQSGDERVLIKMNRDHNLSRYREIVNNIRELIPEATLFTDIIVGFTGETDKQFNNTIKAFKEFNFNMAYIAKYSPRPGAQSFAWTDDIDNETKSDRLQVLTKMVKQSSMDYNKSLLGRKIKVLVNGFNEKYDCLRGLTEGKINVHINSKNTQLIGNIIEIKIDSCTEFSLHAELIHELSEIN